MIRTVLITGANSGIGRAMALSLGGAGHSVILVCRSADKGEVARQEVATAQAASGVEGAEAELLVADLSDRGDIDRVIASMRGRVIDTLVHNAGVQLNQLHRTSDGFEKMFMVNHVAPYLLTEGLLPCLRLSEAPRVVMLSSAGHKLARVNWDDLQCEARFASTKQYCNTKLFNIWFAQELFRRYGDFLDVAAFHPGTVRTGFAQDDPGLMNFLMSTFGVFLTRPETAAKTGVFLAADPEAEGHGRYFVKSAVAKTSAAAMDETAALRLWEVTQELTGVIYPDHAASAPRASGVVDTSSARV